VKIREQSNGPLHCQAPRGSRSDPWILIPVGRSGYSPDMTATPPDPDPYDTPGLERGGGVNPGDTPPGSAQTPAGPKDPPIPSRAIGPVVLVVVAVMTLMVVGFVVAEVMNWSTLF